MSEHVDLLALLRGELGNPETVGAGDHLAACATCREELADTVVGHALLTRAGRTLGARPPEPVLAPPSVPRRTGRWRAGLAVAAAAVVATGVTGAVWLAGDEDAPSVDGSGIEAALAPVTGSGDGTIRMVEHDGRTRMTVAVHDLPRTGSGEFYYAWLLDPATNKMLALGLVDAESGATFEVDVDLVASYSAVDVSLESDDGDPGHSVTSVLRGSYEPDQITTSERIDG